MSRDHLIRSIREGDTCARCGKTHEGDAQVVVMMNAAANEKGTLRRHNYCLSCWRECLTRQDTPHSTYWTFKTDEARWYCTGLEVKCATGVCHYCRKPVLVPHDRKPGDSRPVSQFCSEACIKRRPAARKKVDRGEARKDRTCPVCKKVFTPKNSLGRTCSGACRVKLHRQSKRGPAPDIARPAPPG